MGKEPIGPKHATDTMARAKGHATSPLGRRFNENAVGAIPNHLVTQEVEAARGFIAGQHDQSQKNYQASETPVGEKSLAQMTSAEAREYFRKIQNGEPPMENSDLLQRNTSKGESGLFQRIAKWVKG